jgi:hypothetical protein
MIKSVGFGDLIFVPRLMKIFFGLWCFMIDEDAENIWVSGLLGSVRDEKILLD